MDPVQHGLLVISAFVIGAMLTGVLVLIMGH
jgi:hypothetical protein